MMSLLVSAADQDIQEKISHQELQPSPLHLHPGSPSLLGISEQYHLDDHHDAFPDVYLVATLLHHHLIYLPVHQLLHECHPAALGRHMQLARLEANAMGISDTSEYSYLV